MNAGQRAMVTAKSLNFLPQKFQGKGVLYRKYTDDARGCRRIRCFAQRHRPCNVVIEYAPDLVPGVLAGFPSLDDAYAQARRRKQDAEARMAVLDREAPHLANEVREERMTVNEAWAAFPPLVENLSPTDCSPQPLPQSLTGRHRHIATALQGRIIHARRIDASWWLWRVLGGRSGNLG